MFKHFITVLLVSQLLSACTVAGVLVDGVIYSKADTNYDADLAQAPAHVSPQDNTYFSHEQTLSFADLGIEVDRFLVGLVQDSSEPTLVCKRITKSIQQCEEVTTDNLTVEDTINAEDTVDEMISVRR
ncbi:hypothetical protein [Pseudoalteromonas rhizosphaerae]|uniref:Lipoprotein n=1 Tax=Pseudoalteromonas rhizosphaerae TaxID=2518973 RepID=A0ABW8KXT0_9GAMM